MVRSCSLRNCNNSVRQKYRFFLLPSVKKVAKRSAWLQQCDYLLTEPLPTSGNSISLCEGHFEPDQFVEYGPNVRTILKPTAIPTIFTKNPPRVCDAVELWYEREYKHSNTLSLLNDLTDDSIIYNNDNQDNEVELEEVNDDNGYDYGDVDDSPVKRKSNVRLIRIQRNKMQIATPNGIKVISASCKTTQLSNINLVEHNHNQVEHFEEGLSPPTSNEMETIDDNSVSLSTSSFVTMGGKRICLDVDNRQVAFKIPGDGSLCFESLESEHQDQIAYEDDHNQENYNQDNYNYIESGNSNFNSNSNYNSYSNKRKLVNSTFRKHPKYEITPVFIKKEVNDDEVDDKSRLRDIMHFNISQTDSLESNEDHDQSAGDEIFDPNLLRNLKTTDNYLDDNDNDNYIMNDEDQLHDDQSQGDLDDDIDYSQLIMSASDLQKRVNELESERDSIIRKYRRLELKMETFQTNLRTFLNDDQIKLLQSQSPSMNTTSWSADTLRKSAKVRCIVGPRAYEYLRSQEHYPLPSFRTLYRHREISRINDYTDEMIQEHMNATINRVAMVAEESEVSDADEEVEGEGELESDILDVAKIKKETEAIQWRVEAETEIENQDLVENNSEPEHIDFDALDPDTEGEVEEIEEYEGQEEIEEIEYEQNLLENVQDILMTNNDDDEVLRHEDIAAIDGVQYVPGDPEKTCT